MPAADMETVPSLLIISIPSAHAAIGKANANSARTNTRLICHSSKFVAPASPRPTGGAARTRVAYSPQCIYSSKVFELTVPSSFNNLRTLFSCDCKRRLKFSAHLQHWDFDFPGIGWGAHLKTLLRVSPLPEPWDDWKNPIAG